ncbi:MAG: hypothetical protein Q4E58_08430 [Prevotellaceae bacterium]|nr:hypothetical protein [Prevotellaceae bacterium]
MNAQNNVTSNDSIAFIGEFHNNEYNVYIKINLIDKDILVPGQEILGELDGYFGSTQSSHIWPITSSELEGSTAQIEVINNYGSEDFTASIILKDNNTLEFKHLKGSTFKFPVNKKWQKLPSKLIFIRKE